MKLHHISLFEGKSQKKYLHEKIESFQSKTKPTVHIYFFYKNIGLYIFLIYLIYLKLYIFLRVINDKARSVWNVCDILAKQLASNYHHNKTILNGVFNTLNQWSAYQFNGSVNRIQQTPLFLSRCSSVVVLNKCNVS